MLLYNVVEWCPVAPNNFIRFIHIKIFFWSYFSVSLKVVVNLRVLLYFFFQWRNLLCWNPLLQCNLACLTRVHLEFLKESSNFGGILQWIKAITKHCGADTLLDIVVPKPLALLATKYGFSYFMVQIYDPGFSVVMSMYTFTKFPTKSTWKWKTVRGGRGVGGDTCLEHSLDPPLRRLKGIHKLVIDVNNKIEKWFENELLVYNWR